MTVAGKFVDADTASIFVWRTLIGFNDKSRLRVNVAILHVIN